MSARSSLASLLIGLAALGAPQDKPATFIWKYKWPVGKDFVFNYRQSKDGEDDLTQTRRISLHVSKIDGSIVTMGVREEARGEEDPTSWEISSQGTFQVRDTGERVDKDSEVGPMIHLVFGKEKPGESLVLGRPLKWIQKDADKWRGDLVTLKSLGVEKLGVKGLDPSAQVATIEEENSALGARFTYRVLAANGFPISCTRILKIRNGDGVATVFETHCDLVSADE